MKLSGSYQINLEKQKVWEALNDPEILKQTIPGCEEFIKNSDTKFINLSDGEIECYRGFDVEYNDATKNAARDIMEADVWLIGSPIYNSFFSSALKNLFEYVNYKKTEGKVAGMAILAAGNIGFVDVQTVITKLLSYFRVITNPKAVYLTTEIFTDNEKYTEDLLTIYQDLPKI